MKGFFYGMLLIIGLMIAIPVIRIAFFPALVVNNAISVAQRIADPDNMLIQYRFFHDADAQLKVFPSQIKSSRDNLKYVEGHNPELAASRMTELTGIIQVCQNLVGQYNSRASRLDAGFFRNPERWLPVATAPWIPLPQAYDPDWCSQ